jgi:EAL domain-containing protein (putative c-di-GMP-specific phosphodiesterase class I)
VVYRADIERRLEGAVARGEIVVHYQPIVDLRLGTVTGFEALARWRQGRRLVPPAEWIPVAETTDLIHEIGEHVLVTAARQTAHWRREGHDVSIAVNVSARQLVTARLHRAILAATADLPCAALVVEVTESLALDGLAHRELGRLQQIGVRTALDDFGTGFSALAAVGQLPIDTLKVDRSITRNIGAADGRALVQATLLIAQAIGLTVVAEGVETAAQHGALRELGCHYGQGFLYGRPAPAEEAVRHLTSRATDVAAT